MNIQPNDVNKVQEYKDESEKIFNYLGTIPSESLSSKYPLIEILIPWSRKEFFNLSEINVEREQARKLSKLVSKGRFKLIANYFEYMISESELVINNISVWAKSSVVILILGVVLTSMYTVNENTLEAKILKTAPIGIFILSIVVFIVYVFQYNQTLRMQYRLRKYKHLVELAELVKD